LVLVQSLEPSEIKPLIVGWSDVEGIEVRRCTGCAHLISARRPLLVAAILERDAKPS
jgi:hypothetical protein